MVEAPRRRRWLRGLRWCLGGLLLAFGIGVVVGGPVSWPFDVVVNLGPGPDAPELRAPADGKHRLVVLQHGLWRTSASFGRLERTLRAHGYEVLNPSYPSTRGTIEEFAALLHDEIERYCAASPPDEISFVGHSMGGLVIEQYLRLPDARRPTACVYLGTPHHGAVLADLRHHWFVFRLAMGNQAAMELSPGDPRNQEPIPFGDCSGTLVGDLGAGNVSIPGDDDGTVAVGEATFAGAKASRTMPVGHTRLTTDPDVLRQVLHFLRRGDFAPQPSGR